MGAINTLGLAKRHHSPGLDLRDLRRSRGPSPERRLLGPGQPHRHPELL
jgi:hypothetical protein